MAKSIRSKRERKLRNIKRERYGKKEMKKLKNMLGIAEMVAEDDVKMCATVDADSVTLKTEEKVEKRKNKKTRDLEGIEAYPKLNMYVAKGVDVLVDSGSSDEEESKSVKNSVNPSTSTVQGKTYEEIEMDHLQKRMFNPVTKRDQFGTYPIWFTKKNIKQQKAKLKAKSQKLKRLKEKEKTLETFNKKNARREKKMRNLKKSKGNKAVK